MALERHGTDYYFAIDASFTMTSYNSTAATFRALFPFKGPNRLTIG